MSASRCMAIAISMAAWSWSERGSGRPAATMYASPIWVDYGHRERNNPEEREATIAAVHESVVGTTDTLPRCTNEMIRLFVRDFDTAFSVRIELRMQHVRNFAITSYWRAKVATIRSTKTSATGRVYNES